MNRPDKDGKISVFAIKVPLNLALGLYERLSDEELSEAITDLQAEEMRRNGK